MFAGKKSAQIREILISESAWEEMTCLFAPSLKTIVISLTSLIIGTIASVLVTPLISCLATGVIISGVREAGDKQT